MKTGLVLSPVSISDVISILSKSTILALASSLSATKILLLGLKKSKSTGFINPLIVPKSLNESKSTTER